MMTSASLSSRFPLTPALLEEFCKRHAITRLSLFGSALRDDFHPGSDLDILVEFFPGQAPGLQFFSIQDELSALTGRTVDLHTAGSLSRYFRDRILTEAQVQYVAA